MRAYPTPTPCPLFALVPPSPQAWKGRYFDAETSLRDAQIDVRLEARRAEGLTGQVAEAQAARGAAEVSAEEARRELQAAQGACGGCDALMHACELRARRARK